MELQSKIAECKISVNMEMPEEHYLVFVGGVGMISKPDLGCIKASQKSGKSHTVAILIAAILKGELFQLRAGQENATAIWFDTEQSRQDSLGLYKKALQMSGLPIEDTNRFEMYNLGGLTIEEKTELIETLITFRKPDIVFIDGIVDLILDFNSVQQSKELITNLETLASRNNTAIMSIIHENKGRDDRNARGHLGSMLVQKSSIVLECIKKSNGIFSVKCSDSRHKEVPTWSWCFDAEGNIVDAEQQAEADRQAVQERRDAEREERENAKLEEYDAVVQEFISGSTEDVTRSQLKDFLLQKLNLAKSKVYEIINHLIENGKLIAENNIMKLPVRQENSVAFSMFAMGRKA